MEKYTNIIVTSEYDDSRLDRFIKKHYPQLNQGMIEKALRKKDIRLNQKKAESSTRIKENDEIIIANFLLQIENIPVKPTKKIDRDIIQQIKDAIIYEDENLLVINKPAGIPVQGGSKVKFSIDDILPRLAKKDEKLRLVHRLDRDTSGVLILARNNKIATTLTNHFKHKEIKKIYLAITNGRPKRDKGIIDKPVAKLSKEEREEKEATTYYKVLDSAARKSLIEFTPITGRTHQIRIHAEYINCPILGDEKYGNFQSDKEEKLHLHSYSITLPVGIYIRDVTFRAPLPDHMMKTIKELDLRFIG